MELIANYIFFEPWLIKGASVNDSITVTQSVTSEITITSPADVTISASIPSVTGNLGSPRMGLTTWIVTSNNAAGFNLQFKAGTNPAMRLDATYNFSDYSPKYRG